MHYGFKIAKVLLEIGYHETDSAILYKKGNIRAVICSSHSLSLNLKENICFNVELSINSKENRDALKTLEQNFIDSEIEIPDAIISTQDVPLFESQRKFFEVDGFEIKKIEIYFTDFKITYRDIETGNELIIVFSYSPEQFNDLPTIRLSEKISIDKIIPTENLYKLTNRFLRALKVKYRPSIDTEFLAKLTEIEKEIKKYNFELGYFSIYNRDWEVRWTGQFFLVTSRTLDFCIWQNRQLSFRSNLKVLMNALNNKKITKNLIKQSKGI